MMTDQSLLKTVTSGAIFLSVGLSDSALAEEQMGWADAGVSVRTVRGDKVTSFDDLMNEFGAALQFPYYFGENWSAFQDCIEDLEWLPRGEGIAIVITHAHLVLVDEPMSELKTLVRSLKTAVETSNPIAVGEYWDRPGIPFNIVLQGFAPGAADPLIRWHQAGSEIERWPWSGLAQRSRSVKEGGTA